MNHELQANRIDAKIVHHKRKEVVVLEKSCPRIQNREKKDKEKSVKYSPLRWELQERYPGYSRAWRLVKDYERRITEVAGKNKKTKTKQKKKDVLRDIKKSQKSLVLSTLNIATMFKIITGTVKLQKKTSKG